MDLERSLPDALDGLIPEPPTQLLPAELTALARRRVRRQRALAAAGTVTVVALASVALASYQPGRSDRPGPAATPSASPSASAFPVSKASVKLTASGQLGPDWVRDAVIPYGPNDSELGVDTSGSTCPPGCGPDSAAPGPDGTWWVLDSVKHRLAQFAVDGSLRDVVSIPAAVDGVGTGGIHGVRVLDDGRVLVGDADRLIEVHDGQLRAISLSNAAGGIVGDDGMQAYTDTGPVKDGLGAGDATDVTPGPLRLRKAGTPFALSTVGTTLVVDWLNEVDDSVAHQTRLDVGEGFDYTWASDSVGLVFLIRAIADSRARIVHLDYDGQVTSEPGPDPQPSRMDGLPALRTNSLGWTGLALAEDDGLHLYHRLSPGAVALNAHTCTAQPPPTTDDQGRPIAKLDADLDGDGKPDQVVSYQATNGQYVYQAVLSDGRVTDPQNQLDVFPSGDGIGTELLGAQDFDGDGKAEVLLRSGGNTADAGGIAHLQRCQLVALRDGTGDLDFTYLYGAHSNCCPDTRILVTCDGSHLVETTSQPDARPEEYGAMSDAARARLRRTWERNVYQVGARSAHRISHTTGRTQPGEDVIPEGMDGVHC